MKVDPYISVSINGRGDKAAIHVYPRHKASWSGPFEVSRSDLSPGQLQSEKAAMLAEMRQQMEETFTAYVDQALEKLEAEIDAKADS